MEKIVITRHGKPIARLIPSTGGIDRFAAHVAIQRIPGRASQIELAQSDHELSIWGKADVSPPHELNRRAR